MKIRLGLQLNEDSHLPRLENAVLGEQFFTPRAFVQWLEKFYGIQHPPGDVDHLRIEQYRQLCAAYLESAPDVFFAASFRADQWATAAELLSRRDELLSAGLRLAVLANSPDLPPRVLALARIEEILQADSNELDLRFGFADRLNLLIAATLAGRHPALDICLHEPEELLPPGLRRLLDSLRVTGSEVTPIPDPEIASTDSDLANWQRKIVSGQKEKLTARADGSLILLYATRETHIAAYLARLLAGNSAWKPALLQPERKQTLNNALTIEGLPDQGVAVSSLARPSLQVLKLVTTFLWEPVDLRRTLEFLNLIVKPFDNHFATRLARSLANSPGLGGPEWNRTVAVYLNETLPKRAGYDSRVNEERIREQYSFWFSRRRYQQGESVPKAEVRALFNFLLNWSRENVNELEGANLTARKTLGAQCKRLVELIDALPESKLSYLETERLVRSVYEPTPTTFQSRQLGHLPSAYHSASIYAGVDELIWWDFTEKDSNYFFSRWTTEELAYFVSQHGHLLSPKQKNDRQVWQQLRPLLHSRKRLVLCLSERVDGSEALPHALLGDLEAAFGAEELAKLTVNIDDSGSAHGILANFVQPVFKPEPIQPLPKPRMQVQLKRPSHLTTGRAGPSETLQREYETPTSLDKLIYYPHQYVLQYGLRLRPNDLLSVAADNRLLGNLGHRLIESLLEQKMDDHWDRRQCYDFVDYYVPELLRQEGAVLLEYGREPERVIFTQTMRRAAWSLITLLQDNHWTVKGTELDVEGYFQDSPFKGRADLILERGNELAIIDLKWRGKSVFRSLINNREDLQLNLYAEMMGETPDSVHTAYFIISDGIMIARNDQAFQGIDAIAPDEDHAVIQKEILNKLRATYDWRREQLAQGQLEVRTESTSGALDDLYGPVLNDLLEMKSSDANWDDFRTLIGLLE
ncbi:hypothetical protein CEQ90_18185 [Lewinellaceae bacterium SD302]|nr:hypothetical protein CEQ90_18185 [Lewinellaceae bacterium SD302]